MVEVKDPTQIIIHPHITERSVKDSYGDPRVKDEADVVRKYTFIVAMDANKIEIKQAIEALYNEGKKKAEELISVEKVRTLTIHGKRSRRYPGRNNTPGMKPDRKKAIITLAKGQILEDYGV